MTDIVDLASRIEQEHLDRAIRAARLAVPAGQPGECESCGDDMPRLIDGRCAYCRDGRRKPPPLARAPQPENDYDR